MVETENLIATKKESKNEKPSRHQFKTWYEYFFSVNNLCIGLTNFIIFPAKVHEYRGGAFLVAYFCMLIVIGYPVLYLELIIGQYHRSSPMLFIRRCAPILQGFGWLSLVSAILILFPHQYSVARAFKFVVSLSRPRSKLRMPWSTCDNRWNTEDCYQFFDENCADLKSGHIVFKGICVNETGLPTEGIYSAEEQYLHSVVHKSVKSHMSFSNFDSGMACSIFIIWLSIAFIQLRAGNKTTPLIYVPTVIIFLICPFFFFRALHLDGATIGIVEMIRVEWAELLYSQLWIDALNLVIQSLSIGIGGHTVMASMAQPQRQTFYVASLAVLLDTILSLIIAGTLFSILGHISHSIGRDSVYDLTVIPPKLILTHSTWPVLLRQVAHNAWLWVLFYYIAILVVGWKFCALVLKTISVSIADVFLFSTRSHFYNYFTIGVSIVMPSFGLILCYDGGSTYIPMVEDVQKVATGLFITAEVLIVLEFYGLKIFYDDIHFLMGHPSDSQWSHAYTWSFWKWRWRMAPALSIFYVLTSFFRQYPSPENDPDYNYLYDIIQFFLVFLVILIPLIFGYRSYSKIVRYLAKYEKNKKFDKKMLWSCQRNMRSWNRIVENMSEKDKEFAKNRLPEREPYDLDGYWHNVYRSIENSDRSTILESELDRTDVEDFQIEELEIGEESDEEYNSEDEQLEELLNSEFSKSIESFEETTTPVEPSTVTFETYHDLWFPNDDKEADHKKQKNLDHYSY